MITRPVRERPAEQVKEMVTKGLAWSGHDEVTLTSLSTADFSGIEDTVRDIIDDRCTRAAVSVGLPSLRSTPYRGDGGPDTKGAANGSRSRPRAERRACAR